MNEFNKKIILLNEVESTNNYANQLILSDAAEEGTVVLARYQKKGKGQQGNSWESEYGRNLLMSMILYPGFLDAGNQFLISKVVSLAIVEFLKTETENVSIKWPNDIYVGKNKIAGILIENSLKGSNMFSTIIGIGLNLNQEFFFSDAPNPVSLKQITGKNYEIQAIAALLIQYISEWYKKLKNNEFKEVNSEYKSNLFRFNQWSLFSVKEKMFEARISGIGEFGQLILEKHDGTNSEYLFKEVEFVL